MEIKYSIILITIIGSALASPPQCGLYGSPPCTFLPAPPGSTPSCAGPGKTYCENIPHYPTHLVKNIIKKWGYDVNNFFADETGEEFNAVGYRNPVSQFYGPPQYIPPPPLQNHFQPYSPTDGYKYGPPNGYKSNNNNNNGYNEAYPEPIYIPKPVNNGYDYNNQYNNQQQFSSRQQKVNSGYYYPPAITHYNQADNLKRYVRDLSKQPISEALPVNTSAPIMSSSVSSKKQIFEDLISEQKVKSRTKRQSAGRNALCETRTQFIQPQAALNNKGNWMYVVNQVETARQLVKTETCASTVCANLCQIPNGYNSRCEQKFVQKRLIALDGNGQSLYTDTFWFPSCCVCTISN